MQRHFVCRLALAEGHAVVVDVNHRIFGRVVHGVVHAVYYSACLVAVLAHDVVQTLAVLWRGNFLGVRIGNGSDCVAEHHCALHNVGAVTVKQSVVGEVPIGQTCQVLHALHAHLALVLHVVYGVHHLCVLQLRTLAEESVLEEWDKACRPIVAMQYVGMHV